MIKRILFVVVLICLLGVSLSATAAEKDKMKIVFTPYDFVLDALVALDKGYFDLLGLEVEPVTIKGGTAVIISSIHGGDVNGCFIASPGALTAITKGIDLVQVSGIGNQTFDYYTRADSPINSIKDFEGKKIANLPRPSGPWLGLKYDLDKLNIKAEVMDFKGADQMASILLTGKMDVVYGDPYFEASLGDQVKKVHSATISKYLWNSCGWWFKPEFIAQHPAAVKKFVDGLLLGRLFIRENQEEAIKILAEHKGLKLETLKHPLVLPKFDLPTTIEVFGLQKTNDILQEYGLLDQKVDISKIVDGSYSLLITEEH